MVIPRAGRSTKRYGDALDTVKNMMICLHGSQWKVRPSSFIGSLQAGHMGEVISTETTLLLRYQTAVFDFVGNRAGVFGG